MTGYQKSKSLISAGRPNKFKISHNIVRDKLKMPQIYYSRSMVSFSPRRLRI